MSVSNDCNDYKYDLLLIHPPAYLDFRQTDVYFPFMSSGGSEAITPLYENMPVGFSSLRRYLSERGLRCEVLNLSTLLLAFPRTDLDRFLVTTRPP